jgi:hypothetical protein
MADTKSCALAGGITGPACTSARCTRSVVPALRRMLEGSATCVYVCMYVCICGRVRALCTVQRGSMRAGVVFICTQVSVHDACLQCGRVFMSSLYVCMHTYMHVQGTHVCCKQLLCKTHSRILTNTHAHTPPSPHTHIHPHTHTHIHPHTTHE